MQRRVNAVLCSGFIGTMLSGVHVTSHDPRSNARHEIVLRYYESSPAAIERLARESSARFDSLIHPAQASSDSSYEDDDSVDRVMSQWDLDWPEDDLASLAISVRPSMIAAAIDKLWARSSARYKLDRSEMWLLASLDRRPLHQSTLNELAKDSLLSLPGLAKVVERVARRKLVLRLPNQNDGRSSLLQLTERGRKLVRAVMEQKRAHDMALLFQMPDHERQQVAQMTRNLLRRLQRSIDER
ncbi:transcriptional regulator, MarR family [Burkholderia sp. H160]|nr:transcriptional regulator, MarR family [Burkholderia sp. H160]